MLNVGLVADMVITNVAAMNSMYYHNPFSQ
jgi:hypothetical protein